ncbi:InlB B-repeat-containing protein [Eggerthellaceae bacterium 24-137]
MNKALRIVLAAALVSAMVPAPALADEGLGDAQFGSWRFRGNELIVDPETDEPTPADAELALMPFAVSTNSEGVWKKTAEGYETVRGGKKMTVTNALEFGIDVSYWQGVIDWKKVKAAGVDFAILRCGYIGKSTGKAMTDKKFLEYVKGCRDNGIKIGIYIYSNAWTVAMAEKEAEHALALLEEAELGPENVAYPVFIDMEEENRAGYPSVMLTDGATKYDGNIIWQHDTSNALLAQMAEAFCAKISEAGYRPGVYANKNWFTNHLVEGFFAQGDYAKWVAQYPSSGKLNHVSDYSGSHDMWQCMDKGRIDGISENVDINFAYTDFAVGKPVAYRVAYKLNGGTNHASNAATYTGTLALKNPTRAGYQFDGWYTDAKFTKKVTKLSGGDATLYAKWSRPYKITYKLNKGKNNKANPSKYGGTVTLKNPTRSGYTFMGWYTDKKFKNKVTKVKNKNVTLYAKWAKNYKITYKLNGGKNAKGNPSKYGGTLVLKNPTRAGYVFKGWYSNKKLTKKVTKLSMTKNRTVYAKWAKLKGGTYRINTPGGLYVRATPSTSAAIKGGLANGQTVRIVKIKGAWGQLADGRGWIKLSYAKRV